MRRSRNSVPTTLPSASHCPVVAAIAVRRFPVGLLRCELRQLVVPVQLAQHARVVLVEQRPGVHGHDEEAARQRPRRARRKQINLELRRESDKMMATSERGNVRNEKATSEATSEATCEATSEASAHSSFSCGTAGRFAPHMLTLLKVGSTASLATSASRILSASGFLATAPSAQPVSSYSTKGLSRRAFT